jgi:hypothetical protein
LYPSHENGWPMKLIHLTTEFETETKCLNYIEKMRWPDSIVWRFYANVNIVAGSFVSDLRDVAWRFPGL